MLRSAPLFLVLGLLLALRLPPALALYPYRDGWSQAPAATPVGAAARGARSGINLVYVLTLEGPVEPAAASYVNGWIERASRRGAAAVVLRLDTPGGLDSSLRSMVKAILASRAPVIVYVSPEGARAASAGVFLAYAAHVTAMAPATNIGAAHPVGIGGEAEGAAADKVVNDAVAYLRSLARLRGRDEGFAVEAVRSSRSLTAEEAVRRGAADLLAEDLDDLLRRLEGRRVRTAAGEVRLSFAGAAVEDRPMTARQRLLHALADPNLAYLLLVLGFYGLLFELASPGFGFAGIGGAISRRRDRAPSRGVAAPLPPDPHRDRRRAQFHPRLPRARGHPPDLSGGRIREPSRVGSPPRCPSESWRRPVPSGRTGTRGGAVV